MVGLIYTGDLSVGQLFSIMMYSFYIFNPLYELGTVATTYYEAKGSLEAVDDFLKQTAEVKAENPKKVEKVQDIIFDDVSYAYQDRDLDAVKDITLSISQGKKVAFVGPSGSGKSTIIKLLTGLYAPKKGTLALNDTSYVDLDRDYFRQKIGLVLQETQLFAGTIKENLLFANPDATDEDLHNALLESQADYLVTRNPEGLDRVAANVEALAMWWHFSTEAKLKN
jgi:ATP-binding cassette subfamily B protein